MEFRTLNADEIECRVGTINGKGCTLLLYKDARADMSLLDETVGAENWQRNHVVIDGKLYCNVGVKVNGEWVFKQDVGTESNTEAEKGQASDSFKRACVNWGIGRELYTSPFIWIEAGDANIEKTDAGKWTTRERFEVGEIEYDDKRRVSGLSIITAKDRRTVYTFGTLKRSNRKAPKQEAPKQETKEAPKAEAPKQEAPQTMPDEVKGANAKMQVLAYIKRHNFDAEKIAKICKAYRVDAIDKLTVQHCTHYINAMTKAGGNINE